QISADFCRRSQMCEGVSADLDQLYSQRSSAAQFIELDKLSLHSRAGSVPLLEHLPSQLRQTYSSPSKLLHPNTEEVAPSVKPTVLIAPKLYPALVRKLHSAGMITFIDNPACINGLFAVWKPDGTQRLIFDGRNASEQFLRPAKVKLPSSEVISSLECPADAKVYMAHEDISNCFYQYELMEWAIPFMALPRVNSSDVGLPGDALVYPAFRVLPMGWSHSVLLAQEVHRNIVYTRTSFKPADELIRGNDTRLDRLRFAICIDDLCLFSIDRDKLAAAQHEYQSAMASCNLPLKQEKRVLPTTAPTVALGITCDGENRSCYPPPDKLHRLILQTRAVLAAGSTSGLLLSKIVGSWTWYLLLQRPLLSAFNAVYRFIQCAQHRVYELWPSVIRELRMVVGLAPLLRADFALPFADSVLAHDASANGAGVV